MVEIGQRYRYLDNLGKKNFIGEVIEVCGDGNHARLKIVQDLGYGFSIGYIWNREPVYDSNMYEYLKGQDKTYGS
jgi:hypothetical protein